MIVKLQRPLTTSDPYDDAPVLAYNEGKRRSWLLPMTPALERLFGDQPKVYVEADPRDGGLIIGRLVAEREW